MSAAPMDSTDYRFRSQCEVWKRTGVRCTTCKTRYRRDHEGRPRSVYQYLRATKTCVRCTSTRATRGVHCDDCYVAHKADVEAKQGQPRRRFKCRRCGELGHMAKTCRAVVGLQP